MRLYRKYVSIQLKSMFEYKASLIFNTISSMLYTAVTFFGVYFLFQKFETVAGYTMSDILITYSTISFSFYLSQTFFRGFDDFDKLVISGELDRFLIRPRSVFIQVLGHQIEFSRLGRVIFSLIIMIIALATSTIAWSAMKVLTVFLIIIGAIFIFLSLFLIYSGICIFTIEGLEVFNTITHGGHQLSEYPIDIYSKFFKIVFTYVIPFGCVNYLPLQYLLDKPGANWLYALAPIFTIVFFVFSYLFFRWSLTKYKSTGS